MTQAPLHQEEGDEEEDRSQNNEQEKTKKKTQLFATSSEELNIIINNNDDNDNDDDNDVASSLQQSHSHELQLTKVPRRQNAHQYQSIVAVVNDDPPPDLHHPQHNSYCCCNNILCRSFTLLPVLRIEPLRRRRSMFEITTTTGIAAFIAGTLTICTIVWNVLWTHHPSWGETTTTTTTSYMDTNIQQQQVQLSFNTNRTFTIVQFTDLHYGEDPFTDWGPQQDINSTSLIEAILQMERPDLVLLSGDVITANNINGNATVYFELICQLLENITFATPTTTNTDSVDERNHNATTITSKGVPYAILFGNHDDARYEYPTDVYNTTLRYEIMEYIVHQRIKNSISRSNNNNNDHTSNNGEQQQQQQSSPSYRLSLSQIGPDHLPGVSNYVLYVSASSSSSSSSFPSNDKNDNNNNSDIVLQIVLLDSGGGSINETIVADQLLWYQQQRLLRQYRSRRSSRPKSNNQQDDDDDDDESHHQSQQQQQQYVDAIAFQHIPTLEFLYQQQSPTNDGPKQQKQQLEQQFCYGSNGENGIAPLDDDPIQQVQYLYHHDPSLHFLAVGHNHGNSYCCSIELHNNNDTNRATTTATNANSSNNNIINNNDNANRNVPMNVCFGRHSGYGGYGTWERGARIYQFTLELSDEDRSETAESNTTINIPRQRITWKSWVRLHNGTIIDRYIPHA